MRERTSWDDFRSLGRSKQQKDAPQIHLIAELAANPMLRCRLALASGRAERWHDDSNALVNFLFAAAHASIHGTS